MKKHLGKRILSGLLAAALILGVGPVPAFAEETEGLCPHHTAHTESCGYSADSEAPCTFLCEACAQEAEEPTETEPEEVAESAQTTAAELATVAAHSHPVCGTTGCSHGHPSLTWRAWDGTSSLKNGNYYLTQDVTRTGDYTITGNVKICLNGHTLSTDGEAPGFTIVEGGSLTITDCQGTGTVISDEKATNSMSTAELGIENYGTLTVWNGPIQVRTWSLPPGGRRLFYVGWLCRWRRCGNVRLR